MCLRKGDEVTFDSEMIANYREHPTIRVIDGTELVEHTLEIGKRHAIDGVEKALVEM